MGQDDQRKRLPLRAARCGSYMGPRPATATCVLPIVCLSLEYGGRRATDLGSKKLKY